MNLMNLFCRYVDRAFIGWGRQEQTLDVNPEFAGIG
jgi:hypothetical protein